MLVLNSLFRLVPRSIRSLHRIRSSTNPSAAASVAAPPPKYKLPEVSSMTYRRIYSVYLRRHKLCAVTVVNPYELTKHVGARALVLCSINLIMNAILAIVQRCFIAKDQPQRHRAPEQFKDTYFFTSTQMQQMNIRRSNSNRHKYPIVYMWHLLTWTSRRS